MKKQSIKNLVTICALLTGNYCFSQTTLTFKYPQDNPTGQAIAAANSTVSVSNDAGGVTVFGLDIANLLPANKIVVTAPSGVTLLAPATFTNGHNILAFSKPIVNSAIQIQELVSASGALSTGGVNVSLTLIQPIGALGGTPVDPPANPAVPSVLDFISSTYGNLKETPFGLVNSSGNKKVVHLFFDQFGNSLLSTIPQGIANAQYKIHIVYPALSSNPDNISYSVKQKSGSFSSALSINNSGIINTITKSNFQSSGGPAMDAVFEKTFLLGTATDDLSFDITATGIDETTKKAVKSVLESYTIKMSPVYHVSMDVGLITTNLSNPVFTRVHSPIDTFYVVKEDDQSPKGLVTIMATFYTSPVILLKSIFNKKIPFYKLNGRNFLDDHKFYERIFPAIGVGINTGDKTFNNLFAGLNWEVARGLSVFAGWHYAKVRTFDMPGYETGITRVTQSDFDFYTKNRWKSAAAFGIKADILVISNLFSGVGN